nr:histidinol dehydrogenase [Vulcanisaeta sp. JCM 14467]
MRAQAEHGPATLIVLISTSRELINEVANELRSDENMYYLVEVSSADEAIEIANELAPEHLSLYVRDPHRYLGRVVNAGAVSLGRTPPAIIDYAAGPNHILPTNQWARFRGGLTVYDFLKPIMYANAEEPGEELVKSAMALARHEGFELHARSIGVRYGWE